MPERSLSTKCPAGFWDQEGDKEMPRAGSQRLTLGNVTADEGDEGGGGGTEALAGIQPRGDGAAPVWPQRKWCEVAGFRVCFEDGANRVC